MNIVEGSKIPPEIQPPKRNNFINCKRGGYIIQRIKYLIAFQSFLGINRLYLIGCRSCAKRFCYTYIILLVLADVTVVLVTEIFDATQILFKNIMAIEYFLLAISAFIKQRKPLDKFFSKLQSLDEKLHICDDVKVTSPIRYFIYGIIAIVLYSSLEQVLFISYVSEEYSLKYSIYIAYLGIVVHDVEIIFFCILLIMVERRLRVIKAHVAKIFSLQIDKDGRVDINKVEALSKKVNLDVSSLHKTYDALYSCSQELNYVMTFPITIMILASGLSTILILKNLINTLQTQQDPSMRDDAAIKVVIIIGIGRSLKYILLLMLPCYFSNITKTQVDIIHTLIHDILTDKNRLDKVERRKLKAFSQLCRENAFIYELWGVVRLDMSLPLSYTSLCTTYLIILVQFSKFLN